MNLKVVDNSYARQGDVSAFIPGVPRRGVHDQKVFINPVESALVVIDMQKDFCCADGALFVCD